MFEKTLEFYNNCSVEELTLHLKKIGVKFVSANLEESLNEFDVVTYSIKQCKYSFRNVNVHTETSYKQVSNNDGNFGFGYNNLLSDYGNYCIYYDYNNKYDKAV